MCIYIVIYTHLSICMYIYNNYSCISLLMLVREQKVKQKTHFSLQSPWLVFSTCFVQQTCSFFTPRYHDVNKWVQQYEVASLEVSIC